MPRTWTKEQKKAHSLKLKAAWTKDKRIEASLKWTKEMRNERSKKMKSLYHTDNIRLLAGLPTLTNLKISKQRKLILISDDDIARWENNQQIEQIPQT